jgi:hypothetical protein
MLKKNWLFILIFVVIAIAGIMIFRQSWGNDLIDLPKGQCEVKEITFYYLDTCTWCQKIKDEKTIEKLEALGVKVVQINISKSRASVKHQISGVPTFIINDQVYSGYRSFEDLWDLLNCSEENNN